MLLLKKKVPKLKYFRWKRSISAGCIACTALGPWGFNFPSSCTLFFHYAFTLPVKLHLSRRPGALLGRHCITQKRWSGWKMRHEGENGNRRCLNQSCSEASQLHFPIALFQPWTEFFVRWIGYTFAGLVLWGKKVCRWVKMKNPFHYFFSMAKWKNASSDLCQREQMHPKKTYQNPPKVLWRSRKVTHKRKFPSFK